MVNVEKLDGNEKFVQCSSCLKSTEETDVYIIEVGKTKKQTTLLKLCRDCLMDLGNQIYEIYREETECIED